MPAMSRMSPPLSPEPGCLSWCGRRFRKAQLPNDAEGDKNGVKLPVIPQPPTEKKSSTTFLPTAPKHPRPCFNFGKSILTEKEKLALAEQIRQAEIQKANLKADLKADLKHQKDQIKLQKEQIKLQKGQIKLQKQLEKAKSEKKKTALLGKLLTAANLSETGKVAAVAGTTYNLEEARPTSRAARPTSARLKTRPPLTLEPLNLPAEREARRQEILQKERKTEKARERSLEKTRSKAREGSANANQSERKQKLDAIRRNIFDKNSTRETSAIDRRDRSLQKKVETARDMNNADKVKQHQREKRDEFHHKAKQSIARISSATMRRNELIEDRLGEARKGREHARKIAEKKQEIDAAQAEEEARKRRVDAFMSQGRRDMRLYGSLPPPPEEGNH